MPYQDSIINIISIFTFLSLIPSALMTLTCFPLVVTTLSILRQAVGLQNNPPNLIIIFLSGFITWYIMEPTIKLSLSSLSDINLINDTNLLDKIYKLINPFIDFMLSRVDYDTLTYLGSLRSGTEDFTFNVKSPDLSILIPSFMLSELKVAFMIGFLILLPFVIIDMVVSAVLMSMGMMMIPPAVISLPFKIGFFIITNSWVLVSGAIIESYQS